MESKGEHLSLLLRLETERHEVSADLLVSSISAIAIAVRDINRQIGGASDVAVRVRPFRPGSFEVPFELAGVASTVVPLLPLPTLADVTKVLAEYLKLKTILRGKPPKEEKVVGDERHITSSDGNHISVGSAARDVYVTNYNVNVTFDRAIQSASADPDIKGLTILDNKQKPIVRIERDSFPSFTTPEVRAADPSRERVKQTPAFLRIAKPVFHGRGAWDFIYAGRRITAKIADEEFLQNVEEGHKFGKGDGLHVDLATYQTYDASYAAYVDSRHEVTRVHRYVERSEQEELFE